ncbi:MAG: hypothetical protein WCF91_01490 [bacterium]
MLKHNQKGAVDGVMIALGFCIFVLLLSIGFGTWAFMGRQDYKNNVDKKISAAVKIGKQQESTAKDKEFAEKEKNPLRPYNGPFEYGNINLLYPKTWSGYVSINKDAQTTSPLIGYFYPSIVPSTDDAGNRFALKIEVTSEPYATVMDSISNFVESSGDKTPPTLSPYALPKVPKTIGTKVSGNLPGDKDGEMIILPLRSQTIKISTEAQQFVPDFEKIILPNFVFTP